MKLKKYLFGYRDKRIGLYRSKIKPLGYVVTTLGFICLGIGLFPNGLGFIFYPLGFFLLGLVGIRFSYRKILNKFVWSRRFL